MIHTQADPMARFSGDWEKEFRPQWELQKILEGKGLVGPSSNPKIKSVKDVIIVSIIYLTVHDIFFLTVKFTFLPCICRVYAPPAKAQDAWCAMLAQARGWC